MSDTVSIYSGIEFLDGKIIDHPGYDEKGVFGRVIGLPETLAHVGLTKNYKNFLVAAMAYHMSGTVSTAYGTPYDITGQKLNFTRSIGNGELAADLTHAYTEANNDANEYKITLTYRSYF